MRIAAVAACALGGLLLAGCQTSSSGTAGPDRSLAPADAASGTYWHGDQSRSTQRAAMVARNDRDWAELWARVGEAAPSGLPGGRMAVAIFLGRRDTAGYGVVIERVAVENGGTVVTYREQVPGPAQSVALALTHPYAIRLVDAADGPVEFRRAP